MSPDLLLRRGVPDDADALAELYAASRQASIPAIPPPVHTPAEDRVFYAGLLAGAGAVWLAERAEDAALDPGPAGPVGLLVLQDDWLHSLYVRPGLTGEGIGTALLGLAKALRPHGFSLWVFESNLGARRFYLRHGLVEVLRTDGSANEERAPDLQLEWRPPTARAAAPEGCRSAVPG